MARDFPLTELNVISGRHAAVIRKGVHYFASQMRWHERRMRSLAITLIATEMALLTALKVVLSCVPTAVIAIIITTEMSAAMDQTQYGP